MPKKPAIDLSGFFPPLYARWMVDLLKGPIPEETEATCSSCAMCKRPGLGPGAAPVFFKPSLKCCTYRPVLPNFLVGRVLLEEDPSFARGRATLEARIAAGSAVTPVGLDSNEAFAQLVKSRPNHFGRDPEMVCPHYLGDEGGKCGIWNNRNGVCATFFCKYTRGPLGAGFWHAVVPLLTAVEKVLAHWCVLEVGLEPEAMRALYPYRSHIREHLTASDVSRPDGAVDPVKYRAVWGEWYGREHEFYRACARKVSKLSWAKVMKIGGPEVALAAHLARHAYDRLVAPPEVPEAVVPGNFVRVAAGADKSDVFPDGHSRFDGLEVPNAVLAVLPQFEGRSTEEALQAAREKGVEISPELLRKLLDFQVLVPKPEA